MFVPYLIWRADASGQLSFFEGKNVECHLLEWQEGKLAKIVLSNTSKLQESVEFDLVVLDVSESSTNIEDYCINIHCPKSSEWVAKTLYSDFHEYFSSAGGLFDLLTIDETHVLLTHPKTYLTIQGLVHYLRRLREGKMAPNVIQYFGTDTGENLLAVFKFLLIELDVSFFFNVVWMKGWDHTFANRIKQTLTKMNQTVVEPSTITYFETDTGDWTSYPMRADLMLFTYVAPWIVETEHEFTSKISEIFRKHGKPDSVLLSVDPEVIVPEGGEPIYEIARSHPVSIALESYWSHTDFLKKVEFIPFQRNDSGSYLSLWEADFEFSPTYSSIVRPDTHLISSFTNNITTRKIKAFDEKQPTFQRKNLVELEKMLWAQLVYQMDVWFVDGLCLSKHKELKIADLRDGIFDNKYSMPNSARLNRVTKKWLGRVFTNSEVAEFLDLKERRDLCVVVLNAEELSQTCREELIQLTDFHHGLRILEIIQEWDSDDMISKPEEFSKIVVDDDILLAFQHWIAGNFPRLRFTKATLTRELGEKINSKDDHEFKIVNSNEGQIVHCFSKNYISRLIDTIERKSRDGAIRLASGSNTTLIPPSYFDEIRSELSG